MLINGLYGADYPLESTVTYCWTEHEDDELKKTIADAIVTINETDSYHIEFQMTVDSEIIIRIFQYGFGHAVKNRKDGTMVLKFPRPVVIYLYEDEGVPDELELTVEFEGQGTFHYRVPAVKYQQIDGEELNRRKMIVLVPFQLLRLRRAIEKKRTPETMEALKNLIFHDIIKVISDNVEAGNIGRVDGQKLAQMTKRLYDHIYGGYAEMEEYGIDDIMEEYLILDADIQEQRHKEELEGVKERMQREKEELQQEKEELQQEKEELQQEKEELQQEKEELQQEKQTLQEMQELNLWLLSQERIEDMKRALTDKAFQQAMLAEFRAAKK